MLKTTHRNDSLYGLLDLGYGGISLCSLLLLQLELDNVEHCFSAMDPGVGWISRISKWVFFLPMLIWSICMVKREPKIWTSNCFAQLLLTLIRPIMVCEWTKCLSKKLVQPTNGLCGHWQQRGVAANEVSSGPKCGPKPISLACQTPLCLWSVH